MKTIDDIIFDPKYDTLYAENSDGSGSSSGWEYKEVVAMMKEFAEELIDEVLGDPNKYFWGSEDNVKPVDTKRDGIPDIKKLI